MKHLFSLIIVIVVFTTASLGQNELIIEVTTDKYPEETSWTLYDLDKNVIQTNGVLEKETTHRDTIALSSDTCYYWTISDSYGDGMAASGDLGAFKLYLNNTLIGESSQSNFGSDTTIYSIGTFCVANDVAVDELTFSTEQTFAPFAVSANIVNVGAEVINSIELVYTVDDTESNAITIDGLLIKPGELLELAHSELLEFDASNYYNIGLKVTKINGVADENTSNNELSQRTYIANGFAKIPMYELFTSSTCPPCKPGNENLDALLENYEPAIYSLVKYQANWPSPGDPYFTPDVGRMISSYRVSGVPSLYVELKYDSPGDYIVEDFESEIGSLTHVGLELKAETLGDSIFVNAKVKTSYETTDELFVRIMVVEKTTYGNVGNNGETEFHNVFMKFLTDWEGDNIGVVSKESPLTLKYANTIQGTFVEENTDLRVVAYIFKKDSYEIIQSDMVEAPYAPTNPEIKFNIENGATNVDTLPTIEITSNRALTLLNGEAITNITDVITFTKDNAEGDAVTFTGNYNKSKNLFTLTPNNYLDFSTTYFIELKNVKSDEGFEANKASITFSTIGTGVGINTDQFKDVLVYPNPVNNFFNISLNTQAQVNIYNVAGKLVQNFSGILPGTNKIDMSNYDSGIYFVRIERNNQYRTYKITKL